MKNIKDNIRKLGEEHKAIWVTDDENVFIETWTESKAINIQPLLDEKIACEGIVNSPQPTDEELIEAGRMILVDREVAQNRLDEINKKLEELE